MTIQAKINLDLEDTADDGTVTTKTIQVLLQEASPFVITNAYNDNLNKKGNSVCIGGVIEDLIGNVIFSPRNIKDQIDAASNGMDALVTLYKEVDRFCKSPKAYKLKQVQEESKAESPILGEGVEQSNTVTNETVNA